MRIFLKKLSKHTFLLVVTGKLEITNFTEIIFFFNSFYFKLFWFFLVGVADRGNDGKIVQITHDIDTSSSMVDAP